MDASGRAPSRRADRRGHGATGRRTVEAPLDLRLRPLHRLQGRRLAQGPGAAAAARAAQGLRSRRPRSRSSPDFIHLAGRVLQARLRRPRDVLRRSRLRRRADGDAAVGRLQRRAPQARRRQAPRSSCGPARSRASARCVKLRARGGQRRGRSAPSGAGEPTVGRLGEVRGDTVHFDIVDRAGNMVSATPSGGWLQSSPVIPELGFWLGTRGADVLARGGPSGLARARQAAAHDAVADPGAARRRAVPGLGHARRRPAGPVDDAALPAPRPRRHEPAGGDRRAGLALRAFPDLVLAAHRAPGRAGGREPAAGRDPSRSSSGAATSSRSAPTGRKAA